MANHISNQCCLGISLIVALGLAGCTTYVETPTQQADISPVAPAPIGGTHDPAMAQGTQQAAISDRTSPFIGKPLSGSVKPLADEVYTASIQAFGEAYKRADSPRMAIYFNRVLSDEVREWITSSRSVVSGEGESVSVGAGPTVITDEGAVINTNNGIQAQGSNDKQRGVVAYEQRHREQAQRQDPEASWMWRFEDYFLQPFLKAGAETVDRATILRLVAAGQDQSDPYKVTAVKQIETTALTSHADVLIEIKINRDHASPTGYAFRAVAKETKTGVIVGSVTKAGQDYRYAKSFEAVATDKGYELKKGSTALVLENISQELAIDLMNSMKMVWSQ
jgi:hypothetical protein